MNRDCLKNDSPAPFSQVGVHIAVDNRQERMHAFAMVREGMAFLERTMPLGARFPEGQIFREDRFPVPPNALREILLNAVMHRDYSYYGGHVAIVVFDDRIEIRSYGRLPSGVTVKQLSRSHRSELRNPLIADAFHRTGAVEVWGRGTNRVISECLAHSIPLPLFEEQQGWMMVTFRAAIVPIRAGRVSPKSRKKMSEKMSEKIPGSILSMLTDHPEATIANLAAAIGVSDKTIERNLKTLQGQNRICRIGPDKGGHWEVVL